VSNRVQITSSVVCPPLRHRPLAEVVPLSLVTTFSSDESLKVALNPNSTGAATTIDANLRRDGGPAVAHHRLHLLNSTTTHAAVRLGDGVHLAVGPPHLTV
jgi:hypothetical protein